MYNKTRMHKSPLHFGNILEGLMNNDFNYLNEPTNAFTAQVNIRENDEQYQLQLIAPGLKKEDFSIAVDKNTLTIAFEQKEETKEDSSKWHRQEFKMRSFKRSFALNEKIDSNNISASYENGILSLALPKKEKEETKIVSISVQ